MNCNEGIGNGNERRGTGKVTDGNSLDKELSRERGEREGCNEK